MIAVVAWFVMTRTVFGFQIRAVGRAPHAARYAGFDADRTVWATLLIGGGAAGLAGTFEVAGTFGQMVPQFPTGYGFTAIIVAFLGRLHPLGILLAGVVMAVTYIGGETAQTRLGLPDAAAGLFQAMTLFFLLATDVLVRYRIRFGAEKEPRHDLRHPRLHPDVGGRRLHPDPARSTGRAGRRSRACSTSASRA